MKNETKGIFNKECNREWECRKIEHSAFSGTYFELFGELICGRSSGFDVGKRAVAWSVEDVA